jgi:hypothetical protein
MGGGYYDGQRWWWNYVMELWTVNKTTTPLTFTKQIELNW